MKVLKAIFFVVIGMTCFISLTVFLGGIIWEGIPWLWRNYFRLSTEFQVIWFSFLLFLVSLGVLLIRAGLSHE